jgi:hypothetical protein
MKRIVNLVVFGGIAMVAMLGCGGGGGTGGGAPSVTAPSNNLRGTYSFVGFDVNYSNGTTVVTINENSPSITSWSGSMEFGENTLTQSFVINNKPSALTGTVTITWTTPGAAGIAHITDELGSHDLPFTISGTTLTTYSGILQYGTPSLTVEEYDYWEKVSDSVSPVREGSVTENSGDTASPGGHWIAVVLAQ